VKIRKEEERGRGVVKWVTLKTKNVIVRSKKFKVITNF
jgi:hypothetical protein